MPSVAESEQLAENIIRLRRAERVAAAAPDVSPVRRALEAQLGPTLSRSRAARIFGISQTALDRWVAAGQVPIVLTPSGRREVPRQFAIEVAEAIAELRERGRGRHPLAAALAARREGRLAAAGGAVPPAAGARGGRLRPTPRRRPLPAATEPPSGAAWPTTRSSPSASASRSSASRWSRRRGSGSSGWRRRGACTLVMPSVGASFSPDRSPRSPERSQPTTRRGGTCARTARSRACSMSRSAAG